MIVLHLTEFVYKTEVETVYIDRAYGIEYLCRKRSDSSVVVIDALHTFVS